MEWLHRRNSTRLGPRRQVSAAGRMETSFAAPELSRAEELTPTPDFSPANKDEEMPFELMQWRAYQLSYTDMHAAIDLLAELLHRDVVKGERHASKHSLPFSQTKDGQP